MQFKRSPPHEVASSLSIGIGGWYESTMCICESREHIFCRLLFQAIQKDAAFTASPSVVHTNPSRDKAVSEMPTEHRLGVKEKDVLSTEMLHHRRRRELLGVQALETRVL